MGRSVWTPSNAYELVFFQHECDAEDPFEWDDLIDNIRYTMLDKFPSFSNADHWPERESRCIMENKVMRIQISEYCGLVSLAVVPIELDHDMTAVEKTLYDKLLEDAAVLIRGTWGTLRKIGTFSNGESFFERVPT